MKNDHHPLSLRIPSERLALIDKKAKRLGLTRTDYMVRSALGEITDPHSLETQVEDLNERILRLERWMELSN